ncbi:MAG: hypothetical protein M1438_09625 [Deltaproteobacteria bacterium]|nr:hypothetical protein [Deltaproteobacteria bacterium]
MKTTTVKQIRESHNIQCFLTDANLTGVDDGARNVLALLEAGTKLSPVAQREFCRAWDYAFALFGVLYVGSPRNQAIYYVHLMAEAAGAGVKTVDREQADALYED